MSRAMENNTCMTDLTGEELIITGMSGCFPNCDNLAEFKDALLNKKNLITEVNRRWKQEEKEAPKYYGFLKKDITKFDNGYFDISPSLVDVMEPGARIFFEHTIAALFDAGIHPKELEGSRTGILFAACFLEGSVAALSLKLRNALLGNLPSLLVNRLSYYLKVNGPSMKVDTACSSTLTALDDACRAITLGHCDRAIVVGSTILLNASLAIQFARLGVLTKNSQNVVFDDDSSGYIRSDSVGVLIIQKYKEARRAYAQIISCKSNSDGFKEFGILYPSYTTQSELLEECLTEAGISADDISYIEAHGTGTRAGDEVELTSLDTIAKKRKTPLLIGSVKSNVGHAEGASGFPSMAKSLMMMEENTIFPTINYKKPRSSANGLIKGRIKVITETIPLTGKGIVGVNNFGFGGSNTHILLKRISKDKLNNGEPLDELPRLVCVSGRVVRSVTAIFNDLVSRKLDAEHVALYHKVFRFNYPNDFFRGYIMISKSGEIKRSCSDYLSVRPLYLVFTTFGAIWSSFSHRLLQIPKAADMIFSLHAIFAKMDVNLTQLIQTPQKDYSILENILGNFSVLMCLAEILKTVDLRPNGVRGHSIGEIVSLYFKGVLTLKEAAMAAFNVANSLRRVNDKINDVEMIEHDYSTHNGTNISDNGVESLIEIFKSKFIDHSKNSSIDNVPDDSLIFELGISCKKIRSSDNCLYLNINTCDDILINILDNLGRVFQGGHSLRLDEIYPQIKFPTSRNTPMISPLIEWHHRRSWQVINYDDKKTEMTGNVVKMVIDPQMVQCEHVTGHLIDGRNLVSAAGYLCLVWQCIAKFSMRPMQQMKVVFKNCKFLKATNVPREGTVEFDIVIQRGSGNFEIINNNSTVVTGTIANDFDSKDIPHFNIDDLKKLKHPMNQKDIYKELKLRGYQYGGFFRCLHECNVRGTCAQIIWNKDMWEPFIDGMLQMRILNLDSRSLFVPVEIKKLCIDPQKHIEMAEKYSETLPAYYNQATNIIQSGGIEIHGLKAKAIAKRKIVEEPVLQYYQFVALEDKLPLEEAVRVNMQLLIEKIDEKFIRILELPEKDHRGVFLSPLVQITLQEEPLITSDVKILSKRHVDGLENVEFIDQPLNKLEDYHLIIGSNLVQNLKFLDETYYSLKENCFLLSYGTKCEIPDTLTILSSYDTEGGTLVLLQKAKVWKRPAFLKISEDIDFDWLPKLQQLLSDVARVVLYSEKYDSGILGLVNCLRKEPAYREVKCVFLMDKAPEFDLDIAFYFDQLKKDLPVNVFKNGKWGTYRHLRLEANEIKSRHYNGSPLIRGDLSSLKWIQGPLSARNIEELDNLVHVCYSSLNFKDIMMATGRLTLEDFDLHRLDFDLPESFEFSGYDFRGRKVAGLVGGGALSNLLLSDKSLLWYVPDSWSLKDAATVPIVYLTVLAAFDKCVKKRGATILVHCAAGGIGIAAINVAKYFGCKIFATVGTPEKRTFLKEYFGMKDDQIGYSRDTTFKEFILKETAGKGVDIILNSLAEEKLEASIQCLGKGGTFLEIGKYDLVNNSRLNLAMMEKECSYHGVMLDRIMASSVARKEKLMNLLLNAVKRGFVRPLPSKVFEKEQIEEAFRYMTTGQHMGKILVRINENEVKPKCPTPMNCIGRYYCDPNSSYIITGGLGGFGMELIDWLIMRRAKKIVISSRTGIKNGYQAYRIRFWKSYGTTVHISTKDITTKNGCQELIDAANALGPVRGIFHLSVVLKDAAFENQTIDNYREVFGPKPNALRYLDTLSRISCPELRTFVVFSSISCGRGNAGQTNYGMANSVMERICEKRKEDGYPALAIQWGAVGDVGLVAEKLDEKISIGGTLRQKIAECVRLMDTFLNIDKVVVSSMVVAEKKINVKSGNAIAAVANILGVVDIKKISIQSKLAELGMNSISAVEIKQTLERDFNIVLSAQDVRNLTFAKLQELQDAQQDLKEVVYVSQLNMEQIFNVYGIKKPESKCRRLISQNDNSRELPLVLMLPGIEGNCHVFEHLASRLKADCYALEYFHLENRNIEEMVKALLEEIEKYATERCTVNLICYSFGVIPGLEVASKLEKIGHTCAIFCVDSSPKHAKVMCNKFIQAGVPQQLDIMFEFIKNATTVKVIEALDKTDLEKCKQYDDRFDLMFNQFQSKYPALEFDYLKKICKQTYLRMEMAAKYEPNYPKLKSNVKLIKPTDILQGDFTEDYDLSELCEKPLQIETCESNHVDILNCPKFAKIITQSLID